MPRVKAFNNQPEKIEYFPEGDFVVSLLPIHTVRIIYLFTELQILLITIYPQTLSTHTEKEALIKNTVLDGLQNVDCLKLQS